MKYLCLILMLLPVTLCAATADSFDMNDFARIPILQDGRIKPLGSFARVSLRKLSGEASNGDEDAIAWLAEVLFLPEKAAHQPVFRLKSGRVAHLLGLTEAENGYYSFNTLGVAITAHGMLIKPLLAKDRKSMTPEEQELLDAYQGVDMFAALAGSFSLLLPVEDIGRETRTQIGLPLSGEVTLLDLQKREQRIDAALKEIVSRKGNRVAEYTPAEEGIAQLSYRLHLAETMDGNNGLLRVIPPLWEGSKEWLSPWALIQKGEGSPEGVQLFHNWQELARAYRSGDAQSFSAHAQALQSAGFGGAGARPLALIGESFYNNVPFLGGSLLAYAAAFGFAIFALFKPTLRWRRAAYGMLGIGAALHACALALRMFILLRPPVATLYESMIFVSFIAAVFGLWLERKRRGADGMIIISTVAMLLLMAARVFAADNDTLEVLVAVLNTRFWLATHVICITTGYGSALVAGAMAHLYLLRLVTGAQDLAALGKRLYQVALVALLFTAVGTMLGGIWADQSWGRFWGWDPKENGALLIVLWLIWVLHGRVAGQLGERGFAVAMAFITVIVALAWVGVNLLSVGLHSYGFTDTAANGLIAFCGAEILIIGALFGLSCCLTRRLPGKL